MVTDGLLYLGLGDAAPLPILLDFRTQSVEAALRLELEQGVPHGIHLGLGQTVDLLVQERAQIFRIDIGKCAHGAKIVTGSVLFQTIPPPELWRNLRTCQSEDGTLRTLRGSSPRSARVTRATATVAGQGMVLYEPGVAPSGDAYPGVFRRDGAALDKESSVMEREAEELAKEIEELTGDGVLGSERGMDKWTRQLPASGGAL